MVPAIEALKRDEHTLTEWRKHSVVVERIEGSQNVDTHSREP